MNRFEAEPQVNAVLTEEEHRKIVDRTIADLETPEFSERFVAVQTRAARARLKQAQEAAESPRNSFEKSPERFEKTAKRLREAKQDFWRIGGIATNAMVELAGELREEARSEQLYDACAVWTTSPDYLGSVGADGLGACSGLTHTAGYFAVRRKFDSGRFRNSSDFPEGLPAVEYFYNISYGLDGILHAPEYHGFKRVTVLVDDQGYEKHYVHTKKGLLVIGFRDAEAKLKVVTFFDAKDDYVDRRVADCVAGNDPARLNRLVTPAKVVKDLKAEDLSLERLLTDYEESVYSE